MMKKFGDNCSMAYTDMDSLIYEIRNRGMFEVIQEIALRDLTLLTTVKTI